MSSGGAFAEELVVKETAVFKLPQLSDLAAAAGLPVAFGTAHLALRERALLKAGQTVLVLGAAGGVGTAAVQVWSCQASLKSLDLSAQKGMPVIKRDPIYMFNTELWRSVGNISNFCDVRGRCRGCTGIFGPNDRWVMNHEKLLPLNFALE